MGIKKPREVREAFRRLAERDPTVRTLCRLDREGVFWSYDHFLESLVLELAQEKVALQQRLEAVAAQMVTHTFAPPKPADFVKIDWPEEGDDGW